MGRFKRPLFIFLCLILPLTVVYGANLSNVVDVACQRNPKLKLCERSQSEEPQAETGAEKPKEPVPELAARPVTPPKISSAQYLHLKALAAQIAKVPGNPFVEQVRRDEDLVEFADEDEDDKGFVNNQHRGGGSFVRSIDNSDAGSRVDDYCMKYQENYRYYCQGDPDRPPRLREILYKFCPSFEINCPDQASQASETSAPSSGKASNPLGNPFSASSQRPTQSQQPASGGDSGFPDVAAPPKKFSVPCTPDCDIRVHRHCTPECKCDFIYPVVQKFCNPPPMPLFLSTCRLWYNGCPKYERYHYASQFIYSKAEKGKVVSGTVRPANGAPPPVGPGGFGGPGVGGFGGLGALARAAGASTKKERPEPRSAVSSSFQEDGPSRRYENYQPRPKASRRDNRRQDDDPLSAWIPQPRPRSGQRSRVRGASSTSEDDTSSTWIPQERPAGKPRTHARAYQGNFPVPDDSSLGGAGGNGFHQFDGLTDTQGVLHRPRSRSPFTKPGLWEPNPDNPHNRDHANKWYYHPDSVTADWLNGQVNWGRHWAVPAAGVGGTDGYSTLHFPTIGTFLNIADDYD